MSEHILYRAGYKYQLAEQFVIKLEIFPSQAIEMEFISLNLDG
ncbi:hypothetical protein [Vibrio halioticoli]|nr:hypothetical protein [Vibrio halioticoli]